MSRVRIVVHFKAVLQCEGINVHDDRSLPGLCEDIGVIQNLVFLHGDEKDVHLILGGFEKLIAQVDIGDIKGNVLAGF